MTLSRRTFLTRLASTVAAIALAPQLCRMGAGEMPVAAPKGLIVNPAYRDAAYEAIICTHGHVEYSNISIDPNPPRFDLIDGQLVRREA